MTELLACPFCGNIPEVMIVRKLIGIKDGYLQRWYAIICDDGSFHRVRVKHSFREGAIKQWNTRAEVK